MSRKSIRNIAYCAVTLAGLLPGSVSRADDDSTAHPPSTVAASPAMSRPVKWNEALSSPDQAQREVLVRQVMRSAEERSKNQPGDSDVTSFEQAKLVLQRALQTRSQVPAENKPPVLEKAAFLGVATSPAAAVLRKQLKLSEGVGLVVDYVEPDSPAAKAGLEPFDVAVKLNDQTLINPQQLAVLVRTFAGGDEVRLTVLRESKSVELQVKLVEREVKPIGRILFGMTPDDARPFERGDEMLVTIFDLEAQGRTTVKETIVSQQGDIQLPYLDRPVRAAGLTQIALQQAIATAYSTAGFLEKANVAVQRTRVRDVRTVQAPSRTIQQNDMVMLTLHDVEGPGIATVKQTRIGPAGTVDLPRLSKPVSVLGCTPGELEKSVRDLYRSAGLADGGSVGVSVTVPSATPPADAPKNQ